MSAAPSILPLPYTPKEVEGLLGPYWESILLRAQRWMTLARTLDARMQALQRQGRVGFYGAATGQETVNVAAGLLTDHDDWVFPGLREQLVALVRGHSLDTYVHHLFADERDPGRGRNMPCHPTARDVHYVSMSSVIGTQISQAVGVAYGLKRQRAKGIAIAFFGDGATSSNDFHAGLNFAAVLDVPLLFVCVNNQWAISFPVARQTAASRLADKAAAYGLRGARVDGTDFVGTYVALRDAIDRVRTGRHPEMLELVVYRLTAHSSSDDPRRYQTAEWAEAAASRDPVARLEKWMTSNALLTPSVREGSTRAAEEQVRAAIQAAEGTAPPPPESLTEDVYAPVASAERG
ncbi:MAG TPA: thiamine pyrophosphate-dependent enzyme [Thermoplasmata archaeon]|nr:thiamine pyrophosphate-dependent enzyme [Thermoplasmata archaeon]